MFELDLRQFCSSHNQNPVFMFQKVVAMAAGENDNNYPFSPDSDAESGVQSVPRVETPKMYKVLILNDDYTPMEFVILVLRRFFNKKEEDATKIMLDVHKKGSGVAGVYSLEIAEMKVMQVNQFSQMNQHPLKSTLEEA